jgi:hypothetical protein
VIVAADGIDGDSLGGRVMLSRSLSGNPGADGAPLLGCGAVRPLLTTAVP